jgi:hypothetical protein
MKMMECIEDEVPTHPKGETRKSVTQKNQVNPSNGNKGCNKHKWNQGKPGPPNDKGKLVSKKPPIKKAK